MSHKHSLVMRGNEIMKVWPRLETGHGHQQVFWGEKTECSFCVSLFNESNLFL